MKIKILLFFFIFAKISAQTSNLIRREDFGFLKKMAKDVTEASRIRSGQVISSNFGPNNTGGTLIRPGGRNSYPAFWIRDYAMSLDGGLVSQKEQLHLLLLTAKTQSDHSQTTKWGTFIPKGAIADHIRIDDSKPIYFPGTYDFEEQGEPKWGRQPPFCDAFYFIHMVWYYAIHEKNESILSQNVNDVSILDRLEWAFKSVPKAEKSDLVSVREDNRGVDFGFRDAIFMTGDLCLSSILKYQAAKELAEIFQKIGRKNSYQEYKNCAINLKEQIPETFLSDSGLLKASTGISGQRDVWSTSMAAYYGILTPRQMAKASLSMNKAYEKGNLSWKGNIRHVLKSDDFDSNTAWEKSLVKKDTYQNGAYWGTPLGWVAHLMARTNLSNARKLVKEYVTELRTGDFRKGEKYGSPWECMNQDSQQNSVYMTSVLCPLIVFTSRFSH
jgi:hypothetical protein